MESLEAWIERQYPHAAAAMLRSISPLGLVHSRPGFGQTIAATRGAIVASPVLGAYDPQPDYFFHWYRDSALVIDALRRLLEAGLEPRALEHFADFVRFSLTLRHLDGRTLAASPEWRSRVREDFRKFLRSDEELAAVHGEAVAGDTRVNADGTLDISSWGRPQHDGPALRALAVLRWIRGGRLDAELTASASILLRADLAFTLAHALEPCFDIWEEERGVHYYTLRIGAAALEEGAEWLEAREERREAQTCRAGAAALLARLEEYWLPDEGFYRSRILPGATRSAKDLDMAVILAVLHSSDRGPRHCVHDPRIHATFGRLAALFDAEYPINRGRPPTRAPAMGRYAGDQYYSGGAYYFSTLGAAELLFRAAAGADEPRARLLRRQGDAFLETVRAFTPPSGDLSEQFDRATGEQTSARHLAWSYAALISCVAARGTVAEGAALPARERHG